LNAKDFGIPQDRKRVYITATKTNPISFPISLNVSRHEKTVALDVLETGYPT
jgi:site-specific DNA-cytosine methylase